MEGNFLFDIDQVIQNVSEAEVMSVFFPTFRRALIIDTRTNESVGPFVRLMPMARSPQDRMRSIRRMRPQLPRPANLTLIPWQRYVDSLVESGVWDQIVDRVRQSGDDEPRHPPVVLRAQTLAEVRRVDDEPGIASRRAIAHAVLVEQEDPCVRCELPEPAGGGEPGDSGPHHHPVGNLIAFQTVGRGRFGENRVPTRSMSRVGEERGSAGH